MWGHTKITHLSMTSQNLGVKKSVITMEWTFFVSLVDMMTSVLCITELELFGKRSFASSLSSPRHHHQSQAYVYVWEKWEPSVNIYANCKVYTAKCQVQHFFSSTLLRRPPQVFAILGRANGACRKNVLHSLSRLHSSLFSQNWRNSSNSGCQLYCKTLLEHATFCNMHFATASWKKTAVSNLNIENSICLGTMKNKYFMFTLSNRRLLAVLVMSGASYILDNK